MEWISVKDRLPETTAQSVGTSYEYQSSKKVLIWIDGDIEPSNAVYNFGEGFNQWAVVHGEDLLQYELDQVTHWMPIEPPKK